MYNFMNIVYSNLKSCYDARYLYDLISCDKCLKFFNKGNEKQFFCFTKSDYKAAKSGQLNVIEMFHQLSIPHPKHTTPACIGTDIHMLSILITN